MFSGTTKQKKTFSLIESYSYWGQGKIGVEFGPPQIVTHPLFYQFLNKINDKWTSVIHHKIPLQLSEVKEPIDINGIKNANVISDIAETVHKMNITTAFCSDLTINFMGDHSTGIGTVTSDIDHALLNKHNIIDDDVVVIWIDAHADINTHETSHSGNCHGMPLAIATGLYKGEPFNWIKKHFPVQNILYVGLRDVDPGEVEFIKQHQIPVLQMNSTETEHNDFMNKIQGKRVHISFDVDSISSEYFPCTGTPVPNGLTPDYVKDLLSEINRVSNICKLDIAEFNPKIQPEHKDKCVEIIVNNILTPVFGVSLNGLSHI